MGVEPGRGMEGTDTPGLVRELQARQKLHLTLLRAYQAILRVRDEPALLRTICDLACEYGAFVLARIVLTEPGSLDLREAARSGPASPCFDGLPFTTDPGSPYSQGPTAMAIRQGRAAILNSRLEAAALPWREQADRFGIESSAAFPLRRSGRVAGALAVYSDQPHSFAGEQEALLGELAGCLSHALDSFDRSAALRKISVAVEQSPVTVVITDTLGTIDYVNPRFTELTGYTAAEALGRNPSILKSGDLPAEAYAELWRTLAAGGTWEGEFHNRKKNGELFWEAATIAPIKDPDGAITGYVAIKEDITERKRLDRLRLESEIQFRELYEPSMDGIAMVDLAGRYLDCNPKLLELLGLDSKAELLGRSYEDFTPPAHLEADRRRFLASLEPGQDGVQQFEKEYLRKSGATVPVEVRIWMRRGLDGQAIGKWVIVRDITERQRAKHKLEQLNEELEQRIRARTALLEAANGELDAFSYSVSHDLRAPLRGIDGFSQALLEDYAEYLPEEARHCLARVRAGTRRMGQLIDDLLRLSRVSRTGLQLAKLDLSAMALGLLEEMAQADPGRTVAFQVQEGMGAWGDPGMVRSVLENLLGNAWKYTARTPAARIEVFAERAADGAEAFCVRDNGAGFDRAYANKLFMPFQRLHSTHEFEGSGIGLAIVQRIVHRHGGRAWGEGAVGQGACFRFTLGDQP